MCQSIDVHPIRPTSFITKSSSVASDHSEFLAWVFLNLSFVLASLSNICRRGGHICARFGMI